MSVWMILLKRRGTEVLEKVSTRREEKRTAFPVALKRDRYLARTATRLCGSTREQTLSSYPYASTERERASHPGHLQTARECEEFGGLFILCLASLEEETEKKTFTG